VLTASTSSTCRVHVLPRYSPSVTGRPTHQWSPKVFPDLDVTGPRVTVPAMIAAEALPSDPIGNDCSVYEPFIRRAVAALNVEALAREFNENGQFVFIRQLMPEVLVEKMVNEVRRFSPREIHRVYIPWIRKAGTVGQRAIQQKAPLLYALYRSPAIRQLTSRLAATPLFLKNEVDSHAAALYVYQRPGDHVTFHYDDCGCEGQASYTGTFGVINRTNSRVHFQLFRKNPERSPKELFISMVPGSFVFFCGSEAYHRVTPLGPNEERITYSFAYVRDGKRLRGFRRFTENIKDALLYFGPKGIFQNNYR